MKKLTLVIAPTNRCNLACDYCYNRFNSAKSTLDFPTLEYLIEIAFKENDFVEFVWRGGEPLLVGIEYYKKVLRCQRITSRRYGTNFKNNFQTNGTLLTRRWIKFFKRNNISIGISFDGTTNDCHREKKEDVLAAFTLCKKEKFPVGCIAVINKENSNLIEQYNYIKEYAASVKFSPCFSNDARTYNISAEQYAKELLELFEYWREDSDGIPVKPLGNFICSALNVYTRRECSDGMCLGNFLDIDANGVARVCSHSSQEEYLIGKINDFSSLTELFNTDSFNTIVKKMIEKHKECRSKCEFFGICMGGCCINSLTNNSFMCDVLRMVYPKVQLCINNIIKKQDNLIKYNTSIRQIFYEALSKNPAVFTFNDKHNDL